MSNLPSRKSIRLKDYDYGNNGYYFLTICVQNKENLFGKIVGAILCGRPNNPDKIIIKRLLELENKFSDVKIDEYVIMPNHIHFIIKKTGDHTGSPLRDIIGWFKTMTTNDYISGVKSGKFEPFRGKLWQRNYYDHIIRNYDDYLDIAEYILNNPLKWCEDKLYVPEVVNGFTKEKRNE